MVATPLLDHLSSEDFQHIYEPAEDTFLFLDALEKDLKFIQQKKPAIVCEIGPGSGCISTFLAGLLPSSYFMAIDINLKAAEITRLTAKRNNVSIDTIHGDLVGSIRNNSIDILLFNPPYVESEPEEVNTQTIEAAWAGGINGREVIDRLLPEISRVLSETGRFYLLLERINKPDEVIRIMGNYGFNYKQILSKQARNEQLEILCFLKKK